MCRTANQVFVLLWTVGSERAAKNFEILNCVKLSFYTNNSPVLCMIESCVTDGTVFTAALQLQQGGLRTNRQCRVFLQTNQR